MRLLVVLYLFTLSDGVAALIGARAAWRMKTENSKRPEIAIAWACALLLYAVSRVAATYNGAVNAQGLASVLPQSYLIRAIWIAAFQGLGIWIVALSLMNGQQGFIRRRLSKVLTKFE